MSAVFFTSDTHFGHTNIIRYCNRPFTSVEEMDDELVRRWNSVVARHDVVHHLGDFAFSRPERVRSLVTRLNGRIRLVVGNHDRRMGTGKIASLGFETVKDYDEVDIAGTKVVLCHYPFETWNKGHRGSWHLHGHCHGTLVTSRDIRRLDVGVDTHDYTPYSEDEVATIMTGRGYEPVDHHDGGRDE